MIQQPHFRAFIKRMGVRISKKYLHSHVNFSTIYNSQAVQATKNCINRLMKKKMSHTHNRISFRLLKEAYRVVCNDADILWIHSSHCSKLQQDDILNIAFHSVRCPKQCRFIETESRILTNQFILVRILSTWHKLESFEKRKPQLRNSLSPDLPMDKSLGHFTD